MEMALSVVVIKARQPFTLRRGNSQGADWRETALLRHERAATTAAPTPGYVLLTGYLAGGKSRINVTGTQQVRVLRL